VCVFLSYHTVNLLSALKATEAMNSMEKNVIYRANRKLIAADKDSI